MMKRALVLGLILFFFISTGICVAQGNEGQCDPPPPGPPPDNPDDNYSFHLEGNQSANFFFDFEPPFFVGIFKKGNVIAMDNLLEKIGIGCFYVETDFHPEKIVDEANVLIISTGGLMGIEKSEYLKALLEQFAAQGGTILCFGQQNSDAYGVLPVPQGESLNAYGWSQDSSCLRNSVYFESVHPALSSSTNELIDAGVDGYFSVYPSNSTILLRRKINLEPALLYYHYGNGTVILTSMFTDWAYAHSQATISEIKIIRDLITFAKNPKLPIPMFDLEQNPTPAINLNVQVENNTEFTASKAILKVYSPDRTTLLHQLEAPVSLNPSENTQTAINFTLPALSTTGYGICHVDYELYNAENETIQLPTESASGRFSIYKIITPVTIKDAVYMWVTVKDENIYWGQDAQFTIHFKNTRSESRTLDINNPFFSIGHGGSEGPTFPSFQVILPPGEEYQHNVSLPTTQFNSYVKSSITVRIQYYDANGVLKQTGPGKTFFLLGTMTNSTLKLNTPSPILPGGTLNYSITSRYIIDPLPGNTNIKLTLEKYNKANSQYSEIQTLYQLDHDFTQSPTFQYNGSYSPNPIHTNGEYRIKLEVTAPSGLKEPPRCQSFYYDRSGFNVTLENILAEGGNTATRFIPGQTYTIPIKIKNLPRNNYNVKNGTLVLSISGNNDEIYRKEINGININSGEEKELTETFVFTPTQMGIYSLYYRYWDETSECPSSSATVQRFNCNTNVSVIPNKNAYVYLDIAQVRVIVTGAGPYSIHLACAEAGIEETRNIQIPEGNFNITEIFQIPIGISSIYNLNIDVQNALSLTQTRIVHLAVAPLQFDYNVNFTETFARAGSDLHLNLNIKSLSGMTNPISGQLSVVSSQLNWQDVQTVTIKPLLDNSFTYTIPISADAAAGVYRFDVQFKINDTIYISKQHTVSLPGPEIKFISPGAAFNAGDAITFHFENTGGKNGAFEFEILLKDSLKKSTAEHNETLTIAAGTSNSLSLNLPGNLKTGKYQLVVKYIEPISNETVERIFPISISGLSAALNAYPLKENYFNDEVVSGKAEIANGARDIENSVLNARIVKLQQAKAVEAIFGSFTCLTKDNRGWIWAGFDSGIFYYDGVAVHEITQLPNGAPLDYILAIAAAPNNKIYALLPSAFLEIDGQNPANMTLLPFRYPDSDWCSTIGVDTQSRLWAVYSGIWEEIVYYDRGNDTWNTIEWGKFQQIIPDNDGGVWVTRDNNYGLLHIKADLSTEEITPDDPGIPSITFSMPPGDIQSMHVAPNGSLWLVIGNTLYRFDGGAWTDFSSYDGYPPNGILAVTGDEIGNIYAIGVNSNNMNSIYAVENTKFSQKDIEFYSFDVGNDIRPLLVINGYLYTYGSYGGSGGSSDEGEGGGRITGLLKIDMAGRSGNDGSAEQTAWSENYPVSITSGSPLTVDLVTGKTLEPGVYILKTQLLSSLEQVLAESNKTFSVRDHNVPISISIDGPSNTTFNGFVKPGQELLIPVTITNNTTETHTGLTVIIKKTSPSETVEVVLS
ncbi:MAG: hypothetical protein NT166_08835, partial [Candidatus Aminicenantes bacterium]|nr:hypothetical protein [Candidatus Aminicenantes bacterium]